MSTKSSKFNRWLDDKRAVIAIASCVFGAALILLGLGAATHHHLGPAPRRDAALPKERQVKRLPNWNVALADVVIVAPELGFRITGLKDAGDHEETIRKRLDNQLFGLRRLYREKVKINPALMGGILLHVTVDSSGNVARVVESSSRLADSGFIDSVVREAYKWQFHEIVAEPVTIDCPLLFVREGMDITTIVQWEKILGQFSEKSAMAKVNTQAIQQRHAQERLKRSEPVGKTRDSGQES